MKAAKASGSASRAGSFFMVSTPRSALSYRWPARALREAKRAFP
jgi:hypothetical protein